MPVINKTAFLDRVDNLSLVERHGSVRSLTRKARVLFNDGNRPKDFSALTEALKACPPPFSTLANEGYSALVLIERDPSIAENDPSIVDVILKYEHILDGPNQELVKGGGGAGAVLGTFIFGKGRCSIVEKTTNFYIPPNADGTVSEDISKRKQILVAHTFPSTEVGIVGQTIYPDLPFTVKQGGEVSVPFPQGNFEIQGVLATDNPWRIAWAFIAKINKKTWLQRPAQTWICSEVKWEVIDPVETIYRFSFEFQYNVDTWNPTVVFNDQRTGRPPADVEAALIPNDEEGNVVNLVVNIYSPNELAPNFQPAGYWNVPFLSQVDFSQLFANFFEGGLPPLFE